MIYFDNCATTLKKPDTVAKQMAYAVDNYANPARAAYPASVDALKEVHRCRERLSALFNAPSPAQVAFTANVTEALNISTELLLTKGDTVVTTIMEHNSVLRPLYKSGANVRFVGLTSVGEVDYDLFEKELKKGAKAVFTTHASNLTGDMIDIIRVGDLCKQYGAYFVLDTAQTSGVFPIDMNAANVDLLCFTGHKSLFGPQGIGGICVSGKVQVSPVKVGGSGFNSFKKEHPPHMPSALEAGTLNTPGIIGLLAALDFLEETGITNICKHDNMLAKRLYEGICGLSNVNILGNFSAPQRAPIVAFNMGDVDSAIISEEFWERAGIASRAGAHCAPLFHEHFKTQAQGAVRLSLSYFNTLDEVDTVIETIRGIDGEI